LKKSFPNALVLTGSEARKGRVLEDWGEAPLIDVASHLVIDGSTPSFSFFPMATIPGDSREAAALDIQDVRSLDLKGCRLVILSSCASGAPLLSGNMGSPSMADVFLDAGSTSVVGTLWPVEDELACRTIAAFLESWKTGRRTAGEALSEVQRAAFREEGEDGNSFSWATFSIRFQGLDAARSISGPGPMRAGVEERVQ
jgi:CHAT domain-containing protein